MTERENVQLIESRRLEDFLPIMQEVDFGDRFLLSMLHWCGFGARATPLDFWQVFLITSRAEINGVTGLYRPKGSSETVFWIGWFGIRPVFRRAGIGSAATRLLIDQATRLSCRELMVYTGASDAPALEFYPRLGFERLGPASIHAPSQTMDDSDIVFRLLL